MRWSGRFADEVAASRAAVGRAQALLESVPLDRTYKRDRDGQFSSGNGSGDDTVLSSRTVPGSADSDTEADLSIIRGPGGSTELHFGVGADGSVDGVSAALDRAGVHQLRDGIVHGVAAGEALQREAKGLQAQADAVDARISALDQKTMGEKTENGREYVQLSDPDKAERAHLTREWEALDDRIGELSGGDGEQAARGVIHGSGGDVHYAVTVKLPARWSSVDVGVSEPGGTPDSDANLTVTFKGAGKLADHLSEMADLM